MTATVSMFKNSLTDRPQPEHRSRRTSILATLILLAPLPSVATDVLVDDVVDGRQPVSTFVPKYPQKALDKRLEGDVTVCFFLADDGTVKRAKIRKSSHRLFEKPVLRAIRASSYEPLAKGAQASPAKTCRTFRFRLERIDKDKTEP